MKAKLKVIKDWEFEEFELTGTSFKYSPTGCKGMVALASGDCYRLGNTLGTPVIHGDRNPLSIHLRHPPKGFTGRANQQYSSVA